jgi:hypothetical protein
LGLRDAALLRNEEDVAIGLARVIPVAWVFDDLEAAAAYDIGGCIAKDALGPFAPQDDTLMVIHGKDAIFRVPELLEKGRDGGLHAFALL